MRLYLKKFFITFMLLLVAQVANADIANITDNIKLEMYRKYSISPGITNMVIYREDPEVNVKAVTRDKGFYIDGRNQVPEFNRIKPPHPENVPDKPRAIRTVVPFEPYYDTNIKGMRRQPYMTPLVPNHNIHYSERRAYPYSKQEFIDVWCTGQKNVNGVDCVSEEYAITFVRAGEWTFGAIKAPFKAKKVGKKVALFVMVDNLGLDAEAMHEVKNYAELFNIQVFFGTIDCYIPSNWII